MGFTFNKGLTSFEKSKIVENLYLLLECDGKPIDINKSRKVLIYCCECGSLRKRRLVDYFATTTNLCKSCVKKGNRNTAKLKYVREKISNADKDLSYLTPEWRKRFSERRQGKNNPNYGKKDTEETKRKKRLAAIRNIERHIGNSGQLFPNYNPEACKLIDKYSNEHGYDFQHAENGGEYYIKELGYWVDGYDKKRNVVIEIDEKHHFNENDNLSDRDKIRQNEIVNFLNCDFIRLRI